MIQWLHRLSKSIFATVLLGVLALSFVVWGIADVFTGSSSTAVATVGSRAIEGTVFQRDYRNFLRLTAQSMGREINPDEAQKMGLGNVALQQMISRVALDNYAQKLGLVVSDQQLVQYVQSMAPFRGPTGRYDHDTFLRAIQAAGYTEDQFIAQVRGDLTREQLTGAAETGFLMPPEYVMALFLHLNERRAADYVVVTPDAAGEIAAPDEAALTAFVKANPTRFSTPEYRDIQFASAAPADVDVTVTDAQIAQQYDAQKATYQVAEKREVSQIEFKTEAEAKAARAKLDSGTSFDALATDMKLKPADTLLGTMAQKDIPDAARAKAVFALKSGEASQPVQGAFGGWVILKVGAITPGVNRSLDDVREDLRTAVHEQLVGGKLVDIVNAYQDARNNGDDLATAARKAGMKVGRAQAMDRTGTGTDGAPTAAPVAPEFLAAAFSTQEGEDSDPITAKNGAYYVLHVNGVTPPKLKPLDQVRADATAQWIAQKRADLMSAKAAQLFAQAQKDKSLTGIAATLKADVKKSGRLARNTNDATFPQALTAKLFQAQPGGFAYGPQGLSGNYVIAQVTGVTHPKPVPGSPDLVAVMRELSGNAASDFSISMANDARAQQGVKVNQTALDAAIGTGG